MFYSLVKCFGNCEFPIIKGQRHTSALYKFRYSCTSSSTIILQRYNNLFGLKMGKVFFFGGMGAIVNCAIAIRDSSLSLERLVSEILVEPFAALRTLSPAFLGFMIGSAVLLAWTFVRAIAVRFLLGYNGWFLQPKNPINKVSGRFDLSVK